MSFFEDDMILYTENPTDATKKNNTETEMDLEIIKKTVKNYYKPKNIHG